jgi:hypothetical protein
LINRLTPRRILAWAGRIGAVSALATVGASVALARVYRPTFGGATRESEGWLVLHTTAASILGMAAFAALLVLVWPTGGASPWRRPFPIAAAAIATVVAAVAIVTRDMVTFEQVAFASVRVGAGESGYWFAAFDPDVAFVLVDGAEVGQSAYAATLLVHLVAPAVAGVSLALAHRAVRHTDAHRAAQGAEQTGVG